MFGISKEDLLRNLEKIREQRCAYGTIKESSQHCDCKYGHRDQEPRQMSESFSGCPEINMAIKLIGAMDDATYKDFCGVAGMSITWSAPKSKLPANYIAGSDPYKDENEKKSDPR